MWLYLSMCLNWHKLTTHANCRIIVASERHTFLSSSGRGFWANGRGKRYLELEQCFQGVGERPSQFYFWSSIHLFYVLLSLQRSEKMLSYAGEKTQVGILLILPFTIHSGDALNSYRYDAKRLCSAAVHASFHLRCSCCESEVAEVSKGDVSFFWMYPYPQKQPCLFNWKSMQGSDSCERPAKPCYKMSSRARLLSLTNALD